MKWNFNQGRKGIYFKNIYKQQLGFNNVDSSKQIKELIPAHFIR